MKELVKQRTQGRDEYGELVANVDHATNPWSRVPNKKRTSALTKFKWLSVSPANRMNRFHMEHFRGAADFFGTLRVRSTGVAEHTNVVWPDLLFQSLSVVFCKVLSA